MSHFIAHPDYGFVEGTAPSDRVNAKRERVMYTYSVRMAMPFTSFHQADQFAKKHGIQIYAVLSTC